MSEIQCPFHYANGKQCEGHVYRMKLYGGGWRDGPAFAHSIRFWCDKGGDHRAKHRMEFYPNTLGSALLADLEAASKLGFQKSVGDYMF
jgi:hypothetical protein